MCGDGGTYSVAYSYSHARTNTGSNTYADTSSFDYPLASTNTDANGIAHSCSVCIAECFSHACSYRATNSRPDACALCITFGLRHRTHFG